MRCPWPSRRYNFGAAFPQTLTIAGKRDSERLQRGPGDSKDELSLRGCFTMIRDGEYAAWYRTPIGAGTGTVRLADGRITGGDAFISYGGSYQVDGDCFTATLTTARHAPGQPTVFGIDEVEVTLAGRCSGTVASCSGTARQAPGLTFEVTLILNQEHAQPDPPREVVKFSAHRGDVRARIRSLQARINEPG